MGKTLDTAPETSIKMRRVESILISQPEPANGKSPYLDLAEKWNIKVDFRKFVQVDPVPSKDFRKDKINLADYSAVILNSRNAIDNYFRLCEELKIKVSQDTKFFCTSEAIALYLQKYTQYRKRKVFYSDNRDKGLFDLMKKHKNNETFLWPCTDPHQDDIPNFLEENGYKWDKAIVSKTVSSDLSDLENIFYDAIIFFSTLGVQSLFENFPDFKQNNTRIGAFGNATEQSIVDAKLRVDIKAPSQEAPSMVTAIENYLKQSNK